MKLHIFPDRRQAILAAADHLAAVLGSARAIMVAGGNTPLDLYAEIETRRPNLGDRHVFILDEYVGVPPGDPRTCSNLLRRTVQRAWRVPPRQFHTLSSQEGDALASVVRHERLVEDLGGLDVVVLGLGTNGHLGFNEPGSDPNGSARVLDLAATSVEANRTWFAGEHAPAKGATVGLRTILRAREAVLLAFGDAKASAVRAMVEGPQDGTCPAAYLQSHRRAAIFLDAGAAAQLKPQDTA